MITYRTIAAIAALLVAAPLAAQGVSPSVGLPATVSAPSAVLTSSIGPTIQNAAVGFRVAQPALGVMAPQNRAGDSRDVAMMIVGGVGILVGAVIGGQPGTVVMLGSGIIGLVGLFGYLQ